MVAGTTRVPGSRIGLTDEDRRAMALVSRARLEHGLKDIGAEIHAVLAAARRPLGEWLPITSVEEQGLGEVRLIDSVESIPTPEAEELARDFGSLGATLEEHLFLQFREALAEFPSAYAHRCYTNIREFVVRHPVVSSNTLHAFGAGLPARLWAVLDQQFYIDIPNGWGSRGTITCCAQCGHAMREGKAGWVCRTRACAAANPAQPGAVVPAGQFRRCHQGIQQYWVEPGIDEVRLFDELKALGLQVHLYPEQDKVDLAFGKVGIDLKAYASPEILGRKLAERPGGLVDYPIRWLVIPDALVAMTPSYLGRLNKALGGLDVEVLTVSDAITLAATGAGQ